MNPLQREQKRNWFEKYQPYRLYKWDEFDYSILQEIDYQKRPGKNAWSYTNAIIMADTETSKSFRNTKDEKGKWKAVQNYVVAWTIAIRAFNINICCLYGTDPEEFAECLSIAKEHTTGQKIIIYFHNLAYDYVFLRKFLFRKFGHPIHQLNTKPHYPIYIEWENGIILKDSLILSQKSLERWARDMKVEHQKAVGSWDYDKIRNQHEEFTPEELLYIQNDVLAGVECIQKLMDQLGKRVATIPYTATGIPREQVRKRGSKNRAHDRLVKQAFTFDQYLIGTNAFHGGYTHGNRHLIEDVINEEVKCYDFASSYPYCMLAYKYPCEKFFNFRNCTPEEILDEKEYAFIFKFSGAYPTLKSDEITMPVLQASKCTRIINPVLDNGRVLKCDFFQIYITEVDLELIIQQYNFKWCICSEVMTAKKDYLPRWYTDYVYECFQRKSQLKCGDPVEYAISKSLINSLYGMMVQKPIKEDIKEDYNTGEFTIEFNDPEGSYEKWVNKRSSVLPYQWGIYVTAYAQRNLFHLGSYCKEWVYSDTDSCYGIGWDEEKVNAYNEECKRILTERGYSGVWVEGKKREYWLGIAELDGEYTQFRVLGAKRYCGRSKEDGQLHITVAGVPKNGAAELKDDISNFKTGMIFSGENTGKKTHNYIFTDGITNDSNGNIIGDSIDLTPCDYLLKSIEHITWEDINTEEVTLQIYDELDSNSIFN